MTFPQHYVVISTYKTNSVGPDYDQVVTLYDSKWKKVKEITFTTPNYSSTCIVSLDEKQLLYLSRYGAKVFNHQLEELEIDSLTGFPGYDLIQLRDGQLVWQNCHNSRGFHIFNRSEKTNRYIGYDCFINCIFPLYDGRLAIATSETIDIFDRSITIATPIWRGALILEQLISGELVHSTGAIINIHNKTDWTKVDCILDAEWTVLSLKSLQSGSLASGDDRGAIQIWDVVKRVASIWLPGISYAHCTISLLFERTDGSILFALNNTIYQWDLQSVSGESVATGHDVCAIYTKDDIMESINILYTYVCDYISRDLCLLLFEFLK